jgi:hypothetical protein
MTLKREERWLLNWGHDVDVDTDRLWTAEETARFLNIPKLPFTNGITSGSALSLAVLDAIFGMTPGKSFSGFASSKRQDEHFRPLAQDRTVTWRRPVQRAQPGNYQALPHS